MRIQDRAVRRALNRDNGLRVSAERLSIKNQIGFDALPYLARIARRALHASALTRAGAGASCVARRCACGLRKRFQTRAPLLLNLRFFFCLLRCLLLRARPRFFSLTPPRALECNFGWIGLHRRRRGGLNWGGLNWGGWRGSRSGRRRALLLR